MNTITYVFMGKLKQYFSAKNCRIRSKVVQQKVGVMQLNKRYTLVNVG